MRARGKTAIRYKPREQFDRRSLLALGAGSLLWSALGAGRASADPPLLQADVIVTKVWALPTAKAGSTEEGATDGQVFATIRNVSTAADRLTGAFSPIADRAELRRTTTVGGRKMPHAVSALDIPEGRTIILRPGNDHVALIGLSGALLTGGVFPMSFEFARAGSIAVDVHVMRLARPEDAPRGEGR